jgi:cytochrome P460
MQRINGNLQSTVWRQTPVAEHTAFMLTLVKTTFLLAAFLFLAAPGAEVPQYTSAGELQLPEHYREWVYLTTGFDMSYSAPMEMGGHHMFDNVFVNPAAYQSFLKTGTWPDHTILVLEHRVARNKGSINQNGNYQGAQGGMEVHVKDEARFPGKWAFFDFQDDKPGKLFPPSADCYSCHAAHGAVDNTFVQFYPTLMPIASGKGTLSSAFQKESANPTAK